MVEGLGRVVGDVSWGGDWFFIVHEPRFDVEISNVAELTGCSTRIRQALAAQGMTGGASRNFVLCPGGTYDRFPCGTGTSAKLAGLCVDGKLAPGETYRQTSVNGSVFVGSVEPCESGVIPTLTRRAWVNAEGTFLFADDDPLREGP